MFEGTSELAGNILRPFTNTGFVNSHLFKKRMYILRKQISAANFGVINATYCMVLNGRLKPQEMKMQQLTICFDLHQTYQPDHYDTVFAIVIVADGINMFSIFCKKIIICVLNQVPPRLPLEA